MSGRLTRDAYAKLVDEDIKWLESCPRTLERDHILLILKHAVQYEYDAENFRHSMELRIDEIELKFKKVILRCIEGFEAIRDSNLKRGHQAADAMLKILRGKLNEP